MRKIIYGIMLSFLLAPLAVFASGHGQLIFASTIVRHGDREPYQAIPSDPINWQWGLGDLTPAGMQQEKVTGEYLRNEYMLGDAPLLSNIYKNQDVVITADACNRVIQSAVEVFEAMFPPVQEPLYVGQPLDQQPVITQVPAITTLTSNVNMYINPNNVNASIFNALLAKYAYKQSTYIAENNEYAPDFNTYTQDFGLEATPINSIADLIPYGDNLNVRLIYKQELPDGISTDSAKDLARLSKFAEMQQFNTSELGDFMEGAFLKQVADNMNAAVAGKASCKYALYGGHDSNLLAILGALGYGQTDISMYPTYAGFIDFQLYNDNGQYNVVVNYCANNCQLANNYKDKTCSIVLSKTFTLSDFTTIANQAAQNQWDDFAQYYAFEVEALNINNIVNYINTATDNYNYPLLSSIDTLSQVK